MARPYRLRHSLPSPYSVTGTGIYAIINQLNGKIYIGSARRMNHRWTCHRTELEDNEHGNRYLQCAFNKESTAFMIEVIEESCQGIKRDPQYVERVAKSLRGRKFSPERLATHRARKFRAHRVIWTKEMREAARQRATGKVKSPQSIEKQQSKMFGRQFRFGKKICQYSLDGKFIKTHRTMQEAADSVGALEGNIREGIKNPHWTPKGFYWRRLEHVHESPTIEILPRKRRRYARV